MNDILKQKAAGIKLVLTDCDGVLTDAGVYFGDDGEYLKKFNMRDGMGVERLRRYAGVETGIVTGERSPSVIKRAEKLRITELHLGIKDKATVFKEICNRLELQPSEIAYIGDDYNDMEIMQLAGLSACPADAMPFLKAHADIICSLTGGAGCFREFAEFIIDSKVATSVKDGIVTLSNGRKIGKGHPSYIIAEIGINHNGSLEIAKKLIDEAVAAKVDAVKFQKRTPEICVPKDQWEVMRDTPWGRMSYIDYKRKTEFGISEYATIDQYCKKVGIDWFVSAWDAPSVDFMEQFDMVLYKLASASLTDFDLIQRILETGKPLMLSTGMSTIKEIENTMAFVKSFDEDYPLFIAHSTSAYPCPPQELNLKMIQTLENKYPGMPVGYSGHETGLATTVAAVAMGATFVERHFTLDRAMWGSDHAASVEPQGLQRLVRDIRDIELAAGDGFKRVYESELAPMKRLRVNISDEYKEKPLI
ncbi:3-deoxy-D-manno-octulosonate 8-phosphate phosphatase, YrbI family [Mucilaginibacter pineti]|uniref:3-deoxy-D-manno-octulosonate 8-phosphate phosphatase, YrbI family n=1 Tax=Mucilaginibacter pineti TaxID=1391627 RepID=A0A1G7HFR5_9SPHI|nr:N-acetylneuraminate synthase family protein [Mucilaginibacter pineti]SDE99211.1 3-deoxy-D-manno-octulosonate 8-phosphate phosphatase, YrbI family [Mucilaginibacter pineti]